MAAATFTLYDSFVELVADGSIDLDTDTFKLSLHTSTYTPSVSHSTTADLTNEVTQANGYLTGGATLTTVTWGQTSGTATFDSDPVQWTASGGSITARYAVLYSSTGTELIGYVLLDSAPADVTATDGNTFTVTPNASGWFTIAKA